MSVFIIAEIGSVHNGDFRTAKKAVSLAKECGADAVKFQLHISEAETLKDAPSPAYFKAESRWDYFKRTAFTPKQWKKLKDHCDSKGIEFMASPFSEDAVDVLKELKMRIWKIPSGEMTNLPMLRKIASFGQKIILSSGMSTWAEIEAAIKAINRVSRRNKLIILQCSSEYPCPHERVGINIMEEMAKRFRIPVGLSDHTLDIFTPVVAVSRGASVIEKHLTFSRDMYGSDARHSLEPDEFASMADGVRVAHKILSSRVSKNRLAGRYRGMKKIFEKSIVAKRDLPAGTRLKKSDLDYKKPGTGISAADSDSIVGMTLVRPVSRDQMLTRRDFRK